jgi:hypothetical protein
VSTDTSEKGIESLIVAAMTGLWEAPVREGGVSKPPTPYGGTGWLYGHAEDYDREHCVDLFQLRAFLGAAQPKLAEALDPRPGRPDAAPVSGPLAGGDHEVWHHRRTAPRREARPAAPRPLLRHAFAR